MSTTQPRDMRPPRRAYRVANRQHGGALLVVMMVLTSLFAAGGSILYLQVMSTRSTGYIRQARDALYCAEAGLIEQRQNVGAYAGEQWATLLDSDTTNDPTDYPFGGDLDGDGTNDYIVTVTDNDDGDNDFEVDNDLKVLVTSRCIRYPNTVREVLELVAWEGLANEYRNQSGAGSQNAGNVN